MPLHPGVGLCDCSCNDKNGCDKAKCDNTKWTTNCHSVGQNQDGIFQEQCRRIIHNKRKKRSVGELQDDYSDNVKSAFSFKEEKVGLTGPDPEGMFAGGGRPTMAVPTRAAVSRSRAPVRLLNFKH